MSALLFASAAEARVFGTILTTRSLGRHVLYVAATESTNDLAAQAARDGAAHGSLFVTDQQTGGRGRRGRSWLCPPGRGLLFSVLLRPTQLPPAELGWLPLLAGYATASAIQKTTGIPASIKWPNDIVVPAETTPGWRKLGGVLCESSLEAGDCGYVIMGIGLNVDQAATEFPDGLKAPPTSVWLETRNSCDRRTLLAAVLEQLDQHVHTLLEDPLGAAALKRRVADAQGSWFTPSRVLEIQVPGGDEPRCEIIRGRYAGLDGFGRLQIDDMTSQRHALADAEILRVS